MSVTDTARRSFARAYEAAPSPEAAVAIVTSWKRNGFGGVAPAPEVLTAAWLAQGGRDPRREPQVGDEVEVAGIRWEVGRPPPALATHPRRGRSPAFGFTFVGRAEEQPHIAPRNRMVLRGRDFIGPLGDLVTAYDAILASTWKRAARTATVLKVACDACEGEGSIRPRLAVTLSEVQRRLLREPAEAVIEASQVEAVSTACDKCGGTGRGVV